MTQPQKRAVMTGVLTLLIGTVMLAAANQVILRPEFALHNATVEARFSATDGRIEEVKGITLDLLCAQYPTHRRCK